MKLSVFLFLIACAFVTLADAQVKFKTVTVNLSGKTLTGSTSSDGIPFDEPFLLSGDATGIEKIQFRYRINPLEAHYKRYFGLALSNAKIKLSYAIKGISLEIQGDSTYLVVNQDKFLKLGGQRIPIQININGTNRIYNYYNFNLWTTGWTKFKVPWSFISSRHYYPSTKEIGSDGFTIIPKEWNRSSDTDNTFYLNAGPLHDNLNYDFRFSVYLRTKIDTAKEGGLINKIVAQLKKELKFDKINKRTGADDRELAKRVSAIIGQYIDKHGKLVAGDGKPLIIDLGQPPFDALSLKLAQGSSRSESLKQVKLQVINQLISNSAPFLPSSNTFLGLAAITAAVNDNVTYKLETPADQIWNGKLGNHQFTVKSIGDIVSGAGQLVSVINGTKKIKDDGNLENNAGGADPDRNSIKILDEFCKTVTDDHISALRLADNKPIIFFKVTGFHEFYAYMEILASAIDEGNDDVVNKIAADMLAGHKGVLTDPLDKIKNGLTDIVHGDLTHLSPQTKDLLSTPLNTSIAEYKEMKVSDAALLVYNCLINRNGFKALLNGEAKIDGTYKNIEPNPGGEVDLPSINVLINFFNLINSPAFSDNNLHDIYDNTANLSEIVLRLEQFLEKIHKIGAEDTDFSIFQDDFTRIVADSYIKKSYFLSAESIIDQTADANKNPYVGIDLGIGEAWNIRTIFLHEGLNIYLRPINRNAAISTLHGADYWLKTLSLFIGITQNVSSSDVNPRYSPLFTDASFSSSFLFGVGWRFSTLARINFAGLVYREKSLNPLVTATQVKVTPSVTLSIDLSIAKLFSPFAKMFQ